DLRTPIVGTLLVLENLQNKAQNQSDGKVMISQAILQRMIQSSDRQLNLLNLLLEAHFNEAGNIRLAQQPIALATFVQGVVEDLEPLLTKNSAHLTHLIPSDLPPISADPLQLRRVFENLLTNALNHNPTGLSLTLNATLCTKDIAALVPQTESNMICCTVQDNGVGMTQAQCDRLFERYARGNSTQSIGVGLGLYLCRQIIQAHGGQIGVNSTPGQGSTFWFTLPLAALSQS
ncbi:MAG TPA: HAMP domain-containing sensor histidine kinase, partial [Allocoleopsis sp.]